MRIFDNHKAGLDERDLVCFQIFDDRLITPDKDTYNIDAVKNTRNRFNIKDNTFYFILIGKDGTIKHTQKSPISHEKLFEIIDAMPIRQQMPPISFLLLYGYLKHC